MAPISKLQNELTSETAESRDLNTVRILSVFLAKYQSLSSRPACGSLPGREPHWWSPRYILMSPERKYLSLMAWIRKLHMKD